MIRNENAILSNIRQQQKYTKTICHFQLQSSIFLSSRRCKNEKKKDENHKFCPCALASRNLQKPLNYQHCNRSCMSLLKNEGFVRWKHEGKGKKAMEIQAI